MRRLVKQFTTQLSEALEIGEKANLKPSKNQINNIVITGLGGSGIGGKIATQIVADQLKIPAVINNDYTMPKFINENTLLNQPFVKDPSISLSKVIKDNEILSFVRYEVGEGIEKKTEDFAQEVYNQIS